jgi:ornithine cyclodeaminase
MLDGTYLTQLRTGAAQGAATDILARKDAKIGVLFGAGGQATSQLEAMLTVRQLEYVYIFDVNKERAREFAAIQQERLSSYGANIVACDEPSDIIPEADIITTVTTSKKPVFKGSLVKREPISMVLVPILLRCKSLMKTLSLGQIRSM